MADNPFSLSFGRTPVSFIEREYQSREILDSFTAKNPSCQVCMITGVRGAGKTVLLSDIADKLRIEDRWIVVDLNPERDLLQMLVAELVNRRDLIEIFREARINLSFLGFGPEIEDEPPVTDIVAALRRMLEKLTKRIKEYLLRLMRLHLRREFVNLSVSFRFLCVKD